MTTDAARALPARGHDPSSRRPAARLRVYLDSKRGGLVLLSRHGSVLESAEVKELQEAGVDMKSLSIAAKDTHTDEHVVGYYNTGDRMKRWGKIGAFWGGFWGLLFGSGLFLIPGLGPILVAGPLVAWIIAGLEGAAVVGGVSALGAGLASIGIPKDSVLKYEVALKTDKFLLVVHGTEEAVANAKNIIAGTEHSSYTVHDEKVFA
jgi:hypothetical protein